MTNAWISRAAPDLTVAQKKIFRKPQLSKSHSKLEHSSVGKSRARNIPPRTPSRNPPQTDPNQAEPCRDSEPPPAHRPYAACVADTWHTVLIKVKIKKKKQKPVD